VKKILLSCLFLCGLVNSGLVRSEDIAKSLEDDKTKIESYRSLCELINELIVNNEYKLGCYTNYNHYGPTSKIPKEHSQIKIANYNLLHPGTSKALFKDYALVAKIMNRYDVVSGLELLATVGRDKENNDDVLNLINGSEDLLKKLREQRSKLTSALKIKAMDLKIAKLVEDTKKASDLYRAPGYLRVLQELKKLDPSWGLILSPRGDSALIGSVEELIGFFYRGNVVTPTFNPHCKETMGDGAGAPVACFITLTKPYIQNDLVQHFARRPFMASFKSNNSRFTLVSSHVVFTYSGDEAAEKDLMMKTFGVEGYKDLGVGINSTNFARFAEVKNTLSFMDAYRNKYKDDRIMFLADTNLVSSNVFWPEILKSFPGGELLIKEPTTLSPARYMINQKETNGVANDYDHFILDKKDFSECDDGEVYNYYKEDIYKNLESRYVIRQESVGVDVPKAFNFLPAPLFQESLSTPTYEDEQGVFNGDIPPVDDPATVKLDYPLTPAGQSKMDKFAANFEKYLKGLYTVKNYEIVPDDFQIKERVEGLKRRVFLRQLTIPYYYRFTQEVLSDHFPVAITCNI
jgi:hypothetical protein